MAGHEARACFCDDSYFTYYTLEDRLAQYSEEVKHLDSEMG